MPENSPLLYETQDTNLQPPCLKLIVQDLKIRRGPRMHASLNLLPSVLLGLLLGLELLLFQEGIPLRLLAAEVCGANAAPVPSVVPLYYASRSRHDGQPLLGCLIAPGGLAPRQNCSAR